MPKVSVILPNYNHAPYLHQRIESILEQSFKDFELIILDDASSDNSRIIIESYRSNPHISHIIFNKKNGGTPFKQWDKGIELAKGEWIWIAESDDYADNHFLESLLEKVQAYSDVGFAFTATYFVDGNGTVLGQSNNNNKSDTNDYCIHKSKLFVENRLYVRNTIDNVSECIFKKELYHPEKKALYEEMNLCGDWFFYVLLLQQTDVLECFSPLSYYRKHSFNTVISTEQKGKTFTEGIEIYKYLSKNISRASCKQRRDIAKYWIQNNHIYHYSRDTNKAIKSLYIKEFPSIVAYYYILSFNYFIKHLFKR